jgi:hypothetical protein
MEYKTYTAISDTRSIEYEISKIFKENDLLLELIHTIELRKASNPDNNFVFAQHHPMGVMVNIKARQKTEEEKYRECLDKWIDDLI